MVLNRSRSIGAPFLRDEHAGCEAATQSRSPRSSLPYIWRLTTISRTLALLKPADLFPSWRWIDMMEWCGEMKAGEARLWKEGIYGLMVLWDLKPDEVVGAQAQVNGSG